MEQYFISSTKYSIRERNTKKGKVYDVIFRIIDLAGKQSQKVLCGFGTKSAAKRAYTDFVSNYCVPAPKNFNPKTNGTTIAEAYAKYLTVKSTELKESSIVSIDLAFKRHVLPVLGDKRVDEITKKDAVLFIDDLCSKKKEDGQPYSRKYISTIRGFIYALYEWLASRYDVKNPFERVPVPKSTKHATSAKIEFWERDEFERFLSVVDNAMYKALFATLFFAGPRKGEAFALTPKDYTWDSIHVCKTITRRTIDGSTYKITPNKNAKDYFVPVCEPLKRILDEYVATGLANGSFLFGGESPLAPTTVQRVFERYIMLSGVKRIRLHALRHSFVSLCVHHGANYMVVADLICDSPEQVLRTYGHFWDSDKRTVINAIK